MENNPCSAPATEPARRTAQTAPCGLGQHRTQTRPTAARRSIDDAAHQHPYPAAIRRTGHPAAAQNRRHALLLDERYHRIGKARYQRLTAPQDIPPPARDVPAVFLLTESLRLLITSRLPIL